MPPYKDVNIDDVFEALCATCDILDAIGCRYFLAGGTLLGAKRDGDLIPHDIDFDIDCLSSDEEKILAAADLFLDKKLMIKKKISLAPQRFDSFIKPITPLYFSCIVVEYLGAHIGDICIYTIFSDGIARRFDLSSGMYANAKMSIPAWYYSDDEVLTIRGRPFRSVKAPELVLEKVYGSNWRTPLKPGQFAPERNSTSGSVPDADIEKLMLHALRQGWPKPPADAPRWPQPIHWVGWPADVSREWIFRHEPMIHPGIAEFLGEDRNDDTDVLMRIAAAKAIQSERNRWMAGEGPGPQLSTRQNLSRKLKQSWKRTLKNIRASIVGRA